MRRPILYTFLRCPYAMRARMTLAYAGVVYETREIQLRAKPDALLSISPKGTVPVLQKTDGSVLHESIDIMMWALEQNDPENWLRIGQHHELLNQNDTLFKPLLDRYKYAERYPEQPRNEHRELASAFVVQLETTLADGRHALLDSSLSWVDVAVFPFVRQFSRCEPDWFSSAPFPYVQAWLQRISQKRFFVTAMVKEPLWTP